MIAAMIAAPASATTYVAVAGFATYDDCVAFAEKYDLWSNVYPEQCFGVNKDGSRKTYNYNRAPLTYSLVPPTRPWRDYNEHTE